MFCESFSQNNITLRSGASARFLITTREQYTEVKDIGKTLSYQTTLNIQIENSAEPDWRVVAYTSDNAISLFDTPSSSIDLNNLTLTLSASPEDSCNVKLLSSFFPKGEPGETILEGRGGGKGYPFTIILTVSYTLKGDMALKPNGFYYTELNFVLWTKQKTESWP